MNPCHSRRAYLAAAAGATLSGCLSRFDTAENTADSFAESRSLTGWTHDNAGPGRVGVKGGHDVALAEPADSHVVDGRHQATPAGADGALFASTRDGTVTAYDLRRGGDAETDNAGTGDAGTGDAGTNDGPTTVWRSELSGLTKRGLVVADGRVICVTDEGTIVALDAYTGAIDWKFTPPVVEERDDLIDEPRAPAVADGRVFVAYRGRGERNVHAVDLETGESSWVRDGPPRPAAPAVAENTVFLGTGAFDLDGHRRWMADPLGSQPACAIGPTAGVGYVRYTVENRPVLQSVVLDAGAERWRTRFPTPGTATGSPSVPGGHVLASGASVSVADGEQQWHRFSAGSTTPLVADGGAVLADEEGVVTAVDLEEGSERWSRSLGGECLAGPVAVADAIVVGTAKGLVLLRGAIE